MVVIEKRVEMRERGPSNPPMDKDVQKNHYPRKIFEYEWGGGADLTPYCPKFLHCYRVLALELFTHPVLVTAPLYTKYSRYGPDGICVDKYGNNMLCL